LVAQVHRARIEVLREEVLMPTTLATLGACIREGFDNPEKLAVFYIEGSASSRVHCHEVHHRLSPYLMPGSNLEKFAGTRERVREALYILETIETGTF